MCNNPLGVELACSKCDSVCQRSQRAIWSETPFIPISLGVSESGRLTLEWVGNHAP
jgi:hypothetical protein